MKILFLLAAISVASAVVDEFESFKAQFGKVYQSDAEEHYHKQIFLRNKAYIDQHNTEGSFTYELGINEFADVDPAVFTKRNGFLGHLIQPSTAAAVRYFRPVGADLPTTVDWREKGAVTEVKNQGNCGSCWAFSTTGSLEGQHMLKKGELVSLSEQQLVDCSFNEGNYGCMGGSIIYAFKYLINNSSGDDTEKAYPYIAGEHTKCKFIKSDVGANCTGYVEIQKADCKALKEAVATIGPISVAMNASEKSFMLYKKGVYKPIARKCSPARLDHGVLVVGYGQEDGVDYWLVKNSWGKKWGMEGYFKIAAADNLCGICSEASYPTV